MSTLQIRDLEKGLYDALRRRAERDHRSLAQEAVAVMERGLAYGCADARERRRQLLAEAARHPIGVPAGAPAPAALIREDRKR